MCMLQTFLQIFYSKNQMSHLSNMTLSMAITAAHQILTLLILLDLLSGT